VKAFDISYCSISKYLQYSVTDEGSYEYYHELEEASPVYKDSTYCETTTELQYL